MSKPLLTKTNLILRDRQGRDKLYKFIQYGLKILIEITKKFEYKLKNLNYVERIVKRLGQARSLFRFAAFLGGAEGIPKQVMAIDVNNLSYDQLQPLAFLTSLTSSEVFDSLSCMHDVLGTDGRLRAGWWSCFFWFGAVLATLVHQIVTLTRIYSQRASLKKAEQLQIKADPSPESSSPKPEIKLAPAVDKAKLARDEHNARMSLAKSLFDTVRPDHV